MLTIRTAGLMLRIKACDREFDVLIPVKKPEEENL
jgi:hypothetical protein